MRIQDHNLAWRWTDPQYAVLPNEILVKMFQVPPQEARELFERSLSLLGKDGLKPTFLQQTLETENIAPSVGCAWLREWQPIQDQMVILSWDRESALRTSWDIFVIYWPEFCYPASDDLVVYPESEEWVLLYHHEEEFYFAMRCVNA